ncbi:hypothetical protein, partial [Salmonella enterica]|uniref:hypothetical protein n=1 Tax=Salmonella enterica TaxID=28901 RepID=UPI003CE85231
VNSGYECVNDSCTLYIFAGKNRIAKIVGGQTSYFHTDHLNSTSIITDQSGIKVREAYYFPYGQTRVSSGTQDDR